MILIFILLFLLIPAIGFITIWRKVKSRKKKLDFAIEYRERLINAANKYFRENQLDHENLIWLTKFSDKIQLQLGSGGIMEYKPKFQNYYIRSYHIIINTIPQFNIGTIDSNDVSYAENAILRHIGNVEEAYEMALINLRNPLVWFSEGFIQVTSLPVYILNWFGILTDSSLSRIISNLVYRTLVGIIGLVAFISGLVTIIQGRKDFFGFFKELFGL